MRWRSPADVRIEPGSTLVAPTKELESKHTPGGIRLGVILAGLLAATQLLAVDKWAATRRRIARAQREPSLFDPPRHTFDDSSPNDPETAIEAARPTRRKNAARSAIRGEVYEELRGAGERGLTDGELAEALHWRHAGSVAKRRLELQRAGLVVDSGQRRPSRYGAPQIVWVLK